MRNRRNVPINSQYDMQLLKIPTQLAKRFFGTLAKIWITIEVKALKDRASWFCPCLQRLQRCVAVAVSEHCDLLWVSYFWGKCGNADHNTPVGWTSELSRKRAMGANKIPTSNNKIVFFLLLGNSEVPFSKGNLVGKKPSITISIAVASAWVSDTTTVL